MLFHNKTPVLLIISLLVFSQKINSFQAESILLNHVDYTLPELKKRVDPKFPASYAMDGLEGWVYMNYSVNKEGKVYDVEVVESSGYKLFEKEARRALKKWRYKPATRNGQAVNREQLSVNLIFMLGEIPKNVSSNFQLQYEQFYNAAKTNKLDDAQTQLKEIKQILNMNEKVLMHSLRADFHALNNDAYSRFLDLKRAYDNSGSSMFNEAFIADIASKAINAAAFAGHYQDALKLYETAFVENGNEPTPSVTKALTYIDQSLNSPEPFSSEVTLQNFFNTTLYLMRDSFEVSNVEGNLERIEVVCDDHYSETHLHNETIYIIPEEWENCKLFIFGEPGTELSILQHENPTTIATKEVAE